MATPESLDTIFHTKYDEFAASLTDVFPELVDHINAATTLSKEERLAQYKTHVLQKGGRPSKPAMECPGMVLPGVTLSDALWSSATEGTKKAINQFLSLMTFTFIMKDGPGTGSDSGTGFDFGGEAFKTWADSFMNQWRGKMDRADFDSFAKRMADLFGANGDRLPPFPEKFRKGKLVKLAEEIVKELKPEEFGLEPDIMKKCEEDPSKAFEVLMNSMMQHPEKMQGAMKRIIKKLQDKFQRGEFRPQDLAAEAEEMMKEFSENPAFVEMMESMKNTFGFDDMMAAKAAGQEPTARMSIVRDRLRRKQAASAAAAAAAAPVTRQVPAASPRAVVATLAADDGVNEFASILLKRGGKKNSKK